MVIPKVSEMLLLYQLIDEGLNTPYHTHSTVVELTIIISVVIGVIVISSIVKSNRRKRERELIESVTSLNRGTNSELYLILQLLKRGTPPITIFHDLIIKKDNDEFSQIDLVLVTSEGIIVFEVKDFSGWIYGSGNNTNWTKVLSYGRKKYKFYKRNLIFILF